MLKNAFTGDINKLPDDFIPATEHATYRRERHYAEGSAVTMVCWSHETRVSTEDVLVDMSLLPNAQEGDIAELKTLEGRNKRKLYFVVKKIPEEVVRAMPNVQISVLTGNLLTLLDIPPRSKVHVKLMGSRGVEADLVEIHFKDIYLTRADMWRIATSFIGRCVYASQRINYCDTVRCSINNVYKAGKKVFSAFLGPNTKFVYRSESARAIYFIQMSSEMWHFEENGEVMFHKLVNSFLPEVFRKWREHGAHHVVTIVLFTSVDLSKTKTVSKHGERGQNTRDYFRVVVDQVHINQWSDIMATLRYEFSRFAKEVLQQPSGEIEGEILPAVKGDLMEAISLAMTMVTSKFLDRDLRQTNSQVIIVTPGTGLYDVDYELFYQTSMKLLSIEISIDLVCLSRPPLHVTPLFRFKHENKVVNCVPSWIDISFWKTSERYAKQWIPRCKIYEIQMMGVMENEISAISIDYLPKSNNGKSLEKLTDDYDEQVFEEKQPAKDEEFADTERYRPQTRVLSGEASTSRTDAHSMPASAIISSPAVTTGFGTGNSTTEILSNTIKPKPKMSALSSLLSLGKKRETSNPPSPSLEPKSSSSTLRARLSQMQSFTSLRSRESNDSALLSPNAEVSPTESPNDTFTQPPDASDVEERQPPPTIKKRNMSTASQLSVSTTGSVPQASPTTTTQAKDPEDSNQVWVHVENPSKVLPDLVQNISNFGRWKNVFPPFVKRRAVKWRSLKSPASLPLATEIFPSVEEFERNYTFQIYDVTLDQDKEEHMTPGDLLQEMVAMRLMMGFQIVVGDRVSAVEAQRRPGGNPALIVQAIPEDYKGCRMYMTRANQVHRLACDHYGMLNVQLYHKVIPDPTTFARTYHPMVKTKYEEEYSPAAGNFFDPSVRNVNWNLLDQQLAGFDDMMEGGNSKMFKIRFVLIPVDLPTNHPLIGAVDLDTEEIRLEGLKRIIGQLHKGSYMSNEERQRKSRRKKEIKPPEIKFYTGELGDFLVSLLDTYKGYEEGGNSRKKLFVNETMNRNTITLVQIANEMQSDKGVKLASRRWHWKLYHNCFIGQELVAWFLDNFTDIDSSEDAVEYGNELMEKGLFKHVDNRHAFLDGHYFYQMNPEYLGPDREKEKTSWFSSKKTTDTGSNKGGSVNESNHKRKSSGDAGRTSVVSENASSRHEPSPALEPVTENRSLPKILISRALKFDIDPNERSARHEFLTVHVDRVHNPENAFHLRMEWINATPKLIDESVVNFSRIGERFGWKLVQVPIDEISSLPNGNPFCSFIRVELNAEVELPGDDDPELVGIGSPLNEDSLYYHKNLLTKYGFFIDTVSASSLIKKEVEILYSWGHPFYNYHQYVHKTGVVLAQIVDNNAFILMVNTLHISRSAVGTEPSQSESHGVPEAEKIMFDLKSVLEDKVSLQNAIQEAKQEWIALHRVSFSHSMDESTNVEQ